MWLYLITALGMLDTQSPISARLLHDIHKILLRGKRGTSKSLGEFRKAQNYLGSTQLKTASFVPPTPTTAPPLSLPPSPA
ncbi:hypothetical protein [Bartonella taylorii]|uniref:hypothetical protein n=2 Tax=Bartonella taylorii TaxID=33046 RepID=UPI001ABB70DB|nr:hypothetical protein [Bartonella taylorii]